MRRNRPRSELSVALFPFLAVLICTMGSLIVLLVMVVQQAHLNADDQLAQAEQKRAEKLQKLTDEYEQYEWRRGVLEPQRAQVQKKLANGRSQLSHLEEQIRDLQERWKLLTKQVAAVADPSANSSNDDELARLRSQLDQKRAELDELKKKAAKRNDSYAIIPYDGPNGTRRRPIYIECTGDKLIIQPEGLVMTEADFVGPLGPGNPLDAALRAIREHLADLKKVNPYPLLIVRPDGAQAYAMARQAMSGWEDEFGYELIDGAMKLEYEQSDPALSEKLRRTIAAARQRQVLLAAAMPRQFQGAGSNGFVVSSRGGLRPVGGSSQSPESGSGRREGNGSRRGGGFQERGSATPSGARGGGVSERGSFSGAGFNGGGTGQTNAQGTASRGGYGSGALASADANAGFAANGSRNGEPHIGATAGTGGNGSGSGAGGGAADVRQPGDGTNPPSQAGARGGTQGAPVAQGAQREQGETGVSRDGQQLAQGQATGSQTGAGQTERDGGGSSNGGGGAGGPNSAGSASGSWGGAIAKSRGSNWGLPRSNNFAQAVKRPLRVACLSDRLIIMPGKNEFFVPVSTELTGDMRADVQGFVSKVWAHMEGWGMAVAGGYWTPVLTVEVQDGAESNFQAMIILLQGSGIHVTRSQP